MYSLLASTKRLQNVMSSNFRYLASIWPIAGVMISNRDQFKNKTPPRYVRNGVLFTIKCSPLFRIESNYLKSYVFSHI